ncbi:MAG: diacylglycerol kinase family protein [Actinomycetota bacterium]
MASSAAVIVDLTAGFGSAARKLPEIERLLDEHTISHRTLPAAQVDEATRAARRAVDDGERFIVAVGDDPTVNAVLNGIVADDRLVDPETVLGVLAANTENDVVRSFGLWQDPEPAMERLRSGLVYAIDVGKATATGEDGPVVRYFLNNAQVGLGGLAAARASMMPRALRRAGPFLGFWMAVATFRRVPVRIQGDRRSYEGPATNVLIANLQYGSRGMHLSPRSWPEDGYFDLQVHVGPKSESFTLLHKMFVGEHLPHPNILEYRSPRVRIEADRPLPVQVDRIPIGRTPVTFEVLPRLLRLKI